MKRHPAAQGTPEWMEARAGIPTASEFGSLVSDTFKVRTGEMPHTYLCRKLAEKWLGGPLFSLPTAFVLEQGKILEGEAIPFLEFEFGWQLERTGLLTNDEGTIGSSPDAIIGAEECGVEIKCPNLETHIKYLLAGKLPAEYGPQVHGGMLVTGWKQWKFVSYRRRLPPFIITVQRDEEIIEVLDEALTKFLYWLGAGWDRLLQLNGGQPPPRRPPDIRWSDRPDHVFDTDEDDRPDVPT